MTRISKAQYIQNHFEKEIMAIDPRTDITLIKRIRDSLHMAGYYKNRTDASLDATLNVILRLRFDFIDNRKGKANTKIVDKKRI